jgi:hypothetical protein
MTTEDPLWDRRNQLETMQNQLTLILQSTEHVTDTQWAEIDRIVPRLYLVAEQVQRAADTKGDGDGHRDDS